MNGMMRRSRRRRGAIAAALLMIVSDGAGRARLLASDSGVAARLAAQGADGIHASMRRLAASGSDRMETEQPAADRVARLCRASLSEKVAAVFALGTGSIMFGYGMREKEKKDTIWTPDGKSEVGFGAAGIGLSVWLFHDIWSRSRQCQALLP